MSAVVFDKVSIVFGSDPEAAEVRRRFVAETGTGRGCGTDADLDRARWALTRCRRRHAARPSMARWRPALECWTGYEWRPLERSAGGGLE